MGLLLGFLLCTLIYLSILFSISHCLDYHSEILLNKRKRSCVHDEGKVTPVVEIFAGFLYIDYRYMYKYPE